MSHVSSFNGLTGNLTSDDIALSDLTGATASTLVMSTNVTGDAEDRLVVRADGQHVWGSGSASGDTNLYRSGANALATDDSFTAAAGLTATAGGVTATAGGVTATAGDITATAGNIVVSTAGRGLNVKTGSNARIGTLTLTGATPVVVSTTAVTADSAIFLTVKTVGGTPAFSWVSARSAGTSFSVTGTAGDTSVLNWFIVEPVA